jgi:hypothetical protein
MLRDLTIIQIIVLMTFWFISYAYIFILQVQEDYLEAEQSTILSTYPDESRTVVKRKQILSHGIHIWLRLLL